MEGGLLVSDRNDTNGRFEHEYEHRFAEYECECDGGSRVLRTQDRWSVHCRCCCSHSDPVLAASSGFSLSTGPRYARTIALTGAGGGFNWTCVPREPATLVQRCVRRFAFESL